MSGKILVTGALGQIGADLVPALRRHHGADAVIASDIRIRPLSAPATTSRSRCSIAPGSNSCWISSDTTISAPSYHLVAMLSAVGEQKPQAAWALNMGGFYNVLETARQCQCAVFFPSSIGAFGPSTPRDRTPQDTVQRPTTLYGVSKVAGELLGDYYAHRFGVDVRGVRFPGLISHTAAPGAAPPTTRSRFFTRRCAIAITPASCARRPRST